MIEKNLQITIITYNRSRDLENTFKQLLNSPFSNCNILVLDNASDDETPDVCSKYEKLFSKMEIIRNVKNIGANPNYLKAVELSSSKYTWVLCDDDFYDFSNCNDVIEVIDSEKFDLIFVGAPCQNDWEKGLKINTVDLIKKGSKFHYIISFMPSTIFKTELFDSECFIKGYRNVINMFPQFEFINKAVADNFSVYVSKKEIIKRGSHNPAIFPNLQYITAWVNSCSTINDKELRRKVAYQEPVPTDDLDSFTGFVKRIISSIIAGKTFEYGNAKHFNPLVSSLISSKLPFKDVCILLIIIFILRIIPSFIYKFTIKIFRFIKYRRKEKLENGLENVEYDHTRY